MKAKKLNLGSGTDYREDYINVDIAGDYKVDVVADLQETFPFPSNTIDEILASDILEHFTKEDGEKFLIECHRVLKEGGSIIVRTHNIYEIFRNAEHTPDVLIHFLYGNTSETGVFGAHKFAYTEESLRKLLKKIGFKIVRLEKETTNFLVTAKKVKTERKQLHIAVIQQTPDMGGAEEYMLSLITLWQKSGDTISFASNLDRMLARVSDAKKTKIPMILDIIGNFRGLIKSTLLLPYAILFYSSLLRTYKRQGVEVILMSGFSEKLLVTLLSHFFSLPVVWIEYGKLESVFRRNFYLPKLLYRMLNNIPQTVIVPSNNTKQSLLTEARVPVTAVQVIPCGIVMPKEKKEDRSGSGFAKADFIIGNVSRLTREKGQQFLIQAMPEVVSLFPHARLMLIGGGGDKLFFQQLIDELNMAKYITLFDYVADVHRYYECMDLFVFPTVWDLEGFGLVLPEAMAHKLPVIGSDIGPVPEIIDENKNGLLFPPGDSKALAQCIITLMKDKKRREAMGEAGYKKVTTEYNISIISQRIREILFEATL